MIRLHSQCLYLCVENHVVRSADVYIYRPKRASFKVVCGRGIPEKCFVSSYHFFILIHGQQVLGNKARIYPIPFVFGFQSGVFFMMADI